MAGEGSHIAQLSLHLKQNQASLARLLRWPENIGIQMHHTRLGAAGPEALLLWVDKLASDKWLQEILAQLTAYEGEQAPDSLARAFPIPSQEWALRLNRVAEGMMNGHTALLIDGWCQALLLDTAAPYQSDAGRLAPNPHMDMFARDVRSNVGLIRARLQDPKLRALQVPLRKKSRGRVVMLYLEGRARPSLVRLVRLWAGRHMGEEAADRGVHNPFSTVIGFLPRLDSTVWPDHAALLADSGHILLLSDRTAMVFVAPVTAAAWLTAPNDMGYRFPLKRYLAKSRALLYLLVLLIPGSLVAILNYHSDMIPTAFLAAITSVRENAPFAVLFEVLMMELLIEIGREAAWRLPILIPVGLIMVTIVLIGLLAVHAGLLGPLPVLAALAGGLISLALPNYSGTYLVRVWRFYLLFAAVTFGFFGLATVLTVLLTYLCMARPWSIPFLGPAGWEFTSPEADATIGPRPKGGKMNGKVSAHLR